MRILETIAGVKIIEAQNGWVSFISRLNIDSDGGTNPDGDKFYQPDTTLHFKGKAINADKVPYVVVPPVVCKKTKGVVLGSLCYVTHLGTNVMTRAVVADIGPASKVGEGSPELARRLGLDPNANFGGTSASVIGFEIVVGTPAKIDDVNYDLQSYGGKT